jgi:hypothetical protein
VMKGGAVIKDELPRGATTALTPSK